ncbi:hypothetical protein MKW94_004370, partial [Papaver nudicaule]|nr:hypothetical protein [Papaver nudicaule]
LYRLREDFGIATNNVTEYRAILLGVKYALKKCIKRSSVRRDSKLICRQVQGLWKTKSENMKILCKKAKELKGQFDSLKIFHVLRVLMTDYSNNPREGWYKILTRVQDTDTL